MRLTDTRRMKLQIPVLTINEGCSRWSQAWSHTSTKIGSWKKPFFWSAMTCIKGEYQGPSTCRVVRMWLLLLNRECHQLLSSSHKSGAEREGIIYAILSVRARVREGFSSSGNIYTVVSILDHVERTSHTQNCCKCMYCISDDKGWSTM